MRHLRPNWPIGSALESRYPVTWRPKSAPPREIKNYLDKFVIGQEVYKKRLTIAAAYHFAMIKYLNEHPDDKSVKRFRKKTP